MKCGKSGNIKFVIAPTSVMYEPVSYHDGDFDVAWSKEEIIEYCFFVLLLSGMEADRQRQSHERGGHVF